MNKQVDFQLDSIKRLLFCYVLLNQMKIGRISLFALLSISLE